MIGLIVALLSVLLPLAHLGFGRGPRTRARVIHLLLLYALVFNVGVIGLLFGFIPHVFFAADLAWVSQCGVSIIGHCLRRLRLSGR